MANAVKNVNLICRRPVHGSANNVCQLKNEPANNGAVVTNSFACLTSKVGLSVAITAWEE